MLTLTCYALSALQLEQIMLAPNESFCVSSLAALREVNSLKSSMTKTVAEATLNSFVAKGWLMKSRCTHYPQGRICAWTNHSDPGAAATPSQHAPSLNSRHTFVRHTKMRLSSARSAWRLVRDLLAISPK